MNGKPVYILTTLATRWATRLFDNLGTGNWELGTGI